METDFAEVCPALRRSHRHDAIVFQERLKMPVGFRFLPQSVNLGFSALVDDHAEPDEEARMRAREDEALQSCGFPPGTAGWSH